MLGYLCHNIGFQKEYIASELFADLLRMKHFKFDEDATEKQERKVMYHEC